MQTSYLHVDLCVETQNNRIFTKLRNEQTKTEVFTEYFILSVSAQQTLVSFREHVTQYAIDSVKIIPEDF